jgi:hypothetical protein
VGVTITLSNPTEIDFGTLKPGTPSANVPPSYSATVPHAGSIQLDYSNAGLRLDITIDPGNELSRAGSTPTLSTNLSCGLGTSATDAAASQIGCQGQNFNITNAPSGTTSFIFVGGQTSAPANAPAGEYRGTVTVRVTVTSQ